MIPNDTLPALIHHGSPDPPGDFDALGVSRGRARVPLPPGDPVAGKYGPLTRLWGSTAT